MNISEYTYKKSKGLIKITKVDTSYMAEIQRFNSETGERLPLEFENIPLDWPLNQIANIGGDNIHSQGLIVEYQTLISDMQALDNEGK